MQRNCGRKIQVAPFKHRPLALNFRTREWGYIFWNKTCVLCGAAFVSAAPGSREQLRRPASVWSAAYFSVRTFRLLNSVYAKQRDGRRFCFANEKFENLGGGGGEEIPSESQTVRIYFFLFSLSLSLSLSRVSKVTRGRMDRCRLLRNVLSNWRCSALQL